MPAYPIGTPGKPWGDEERDAWRAKVSGSIQRSYYEEVVEKLEKKLDNDLFVMESYGALSYDPERYKLYFVKSKSWDQNKKTILITGGVHGYETSGVQGALLFLMTSAKDYNKKFNIVCCPCVSPWGYEYIQRWNRNAEDPNRGFYDGTSREECEAVMALVEKLGGRDLFSVHVDLHETTDTDELEFRPAKMARDGDVWKAGTIPDGFYLVGDTENPQEEWHKAIIDSVKQVTHIAPPDDEGLIIGCKPSQEGVIYYPAKSVHLCSSVTNAAYATTTEVYPDSPKVDDDNCNQAQVAAITGALDYVLNKYD